MLYIGNRSLLPKQTVTPTIQKIILNYRYQISTQHLQKTFSPLKIIIHSNAIQTKTNPKINRLLKSMLED